MALARAPNIPTQNHCFFFIQTYTIIDKRKNNKICVDNEKCIGCKICLKTFGCPAFIWKEDIKKVEIDENLCNGCGACIEVCPSNAFQRKE